MVEITNVNGSIKGNVICSIIERGDVDSDNIESKEVVIELSDLFNEDAAKNGIRRLKDDIYSIKKDGKYSILFLESKKITPYMYQYVYIAKYNYDCNHVIGIYEIAGKELSDLYINKTEEYKSYEKFWEKELDLELVDQDEELIAEFGCEKLEQVFDRSFIIQKDSKIFLKLFNELFNRIHRKESVTCIPNFSFDFEYILPDPLSF